METSGPGLDPPLYSISAGADPDSLISVILFFIFLLLTALFTAGDAALISLSDNTLKKYAESADERKQKKAQLILRMLERPSCFKFSSSVEISLCAFAACFCFTHAWASTIISLLSQKAVLLHLPDWLIPTLTVLIGIFLCGYIILVFGQHLPKNLADAHPEGIAFSLVRLLWILKGVFLPAVWLVRGTTGLFSRLFGIDLKEIEGSVTEEDIRMLVDVGNETGIIEESQRDMINNIFEFDDRTAGDIMTHRVDLVAVSEHDKISDIIYLAINEGFSRIPVYSDSIDNIVGVIYVKDLLCLVGTAGTNDFKIAHFIRSVPYVPETARCRELFKEFTSQKTHLAVVIDEYGGTAGIITMEDLLETIVGNIQDEYDDEQEDIIQINENTYSIAGSAYLEDVFKILHLDMEEDDSLRDYDTLGGLITDLLGRIPDEKENPVIRYQNIEFTVLLVEERHIERIRAVILAPEEPPAPTETDADQKHNK